MTKILDTKEQIKELSLKPFGLISQDWGLVSAKKIDGDYNTMTIAWGNFGTLWREPVVTVYVKHNRYTYEFMEDSNYFTLSFFPEEYKKALGILGSKSGKDGDKIALTNLTVTENENDIYFKEASLIFICEKIYADDLDLNKMPQFAIDGFYKNEPTHKMYIGRVKKVIINE